MIMSLIVYVDGKYLPQEQAVVSVFDHGFLYGDGVFEGIRSYEGVVFRLDEHLVRLYESAKTIGLEIPISIKAMEEVVLETIRRNNLRDSYIRLVVSRGFGDLGLDPRKCPKPSIVCITASISLYPQEMYENGLEVVITSTRKNRPDVQSPRVKSLNYLSNIMAKMELARQGLLEGIMLTVDGYVAEATADNIFILKKGILYTPPKFLGILEGVTRNAVIELARKAGFEVREEVFTAHDLYNAEEVFLTGTAAEVIPVVKIDGRTVGNGRPGAVTKQLIAAFRESTKWDGTKIYNA
jgi:branched-chain amino acid aminotransferase